MTLTQEIDEALLLPMIQTKPLDQTLLDGHVNHLVDHGVGATATLESAVRGREHGDRSGLDVVRATRTIESQNHLIAR